MCLRQLHPPPFPTRDLARIVLEEMLSKCWIPLRIPTKNEKHCLDQITKFAKLYQRDRLDAFNHKLNQLCDIAHVNVEELIKISGNQEWKIDFQFLEGQHQVPQKGSMAGEDRILARREENRERKRINFEARKANEVKQRGTLETDSLHDSSEDTTDDYEIYVPSPKRVKRDDSVALKVPRKTLLQHTTAVADRLGLSKRQYL